MPNSLNNSAFPHLNRIQQINDSYCGPAALVMLLSHLGIDSDQYTIAKSADVLGTIGKHGTTIPQLSQAVINLYPQLQFWYKYNSTISELSRIVNQHQQPVGVEWQGVFPDNDDDDDYDPDNDFYTNEDDDDPGHYSVITQVDTANNIIMIADPYIDFAGKDRRFSILQFERRWWDINEVYDRYTGRRQEVDDFHALFFVTHKLETFPLQYDMIAAS